MKKFTVILRESWQTEATVYAETKEEARKIAENWAAGMITSIRSAAGKRTAASKCMKKRGNDHAVGDPLGEDRI